MNAAASPHVHDAAPSAWVVRFAPLVAAGGTVLDVAAGSGRHAAYFAAQGHPVVAVDRDATSLERLRAVPAIATRVIDLEAVASPFGDTRYAGIVITNYLHRPLFTALLAALAPDGVLLYETFMQGNERHGRPSNPAYLLAPGELLQAFDKALRVVAFEQGEITHAGRTAVVQRLAAVGRAHAWPAPLASLAA